MDQLIEESMVLETITANLAGKPEYKTLNGRRHLVVPLSMLVPGVLNGSKGPLLYPMDEIKRDYDAWNNMPIVVNHPQDKDGNSVSARSPEILDSFGVGSVFGATANGKLSAFGWLDEDRSRRIIPEEFAKLERGEPVELSTGLFTDNIPVKNGKADDGKRYDAVARNYRPDHLAILPHDRGACSIKDGCGMNVNKAATENQQLSHSDLRRRLSELLRERDGTQCEIVDVFDKTLVYVVSESSDVVSYPVAEPKFYETGYTTDLRTGKVQLAESSVPVRKQTEYVPTKNEAGHDCECGGTCGKCSKVKVKESEAVVTDVGATENNYPGCGKMLPKSKRKAKLKKRKYGKKSTITNQLVTNKETGMALTKDQKEELIDNLITNEGVVDADENPVAGPWDEDDRTALNSLADEKLEALDHQRDLAANAKSYPKQKMEMMEDEDEEDEDEDEDEMPPPRKKRKVTKNQQRPVVNHQPPRKKTTDEWLADAPEEIRSAVTNALSFERSRKEQLIANIRKRTEEYSKKELADMQVGSLEKLSRAIIANSGDQDRDDSTGFPQIPNYAGIPSVTRNLGEDFATEDLDMAPNYGSWEEAATADDK